MPRVTIAHTKYYAGRAVTRGRRPRRALRAAATELEQLREQNRLLRAAAAFFGELSERLNEQLRRERALRRAEQKAAAANSIAAAHRRS